MKGTQKTYLKQLKRLAKNTDLDNPERVERFVFDLDCKNKMRNLFFDAYTHYCKANEIMWTRPSSIDNA